MPKQYISVEIQKRVKARANHCCEYCRSPAIYATQPFVYEHIAPLAKGGHTTLNNLAYACGGCNGHKYTKTEAIDPVSGHAVALYNPRTQAWYQHFAWSDDYLHAVGLTATGRATLLALNLNRLGVVNMRRLLLLAGKHPPLA